MSEIENFKEFNLDLSCMFKAGLLRRGQNISSLARVLGFSEQQVTNIIEMPVTTPCFELAEVICQLELNAEYYDVYFDQLKRIKDRRRQ